MFTMMSSRTKGRHDPTPRMSPATLRHRPSPTDLSPFAHIAYAALEILLPGHALAYKWIRTCISRLSRYEDESEKSHTLSYQ